MNTINIFELNPGGMRLTSLKRVLMIRFMHVIWHLNLELWVARKLLWQPNMVTSMVLYQLNQFQLGISMTMIPFNER